MARKLLHICILLLFGTILIHALEQRSKHKAEQIIRDICQRLYDDDLYSDENRKWYRLCEEWIEKKERKRYEILQDETIMDEPYMTHIVQPRRGGRGGGGGGRGGGRFSGGGFRGFRSGSSSRSGSSGRIGSGTRSSSSSIARFRNIRTGTIISRPIGWQWSRSRSGFLPISTHYYYRSHSSSNRYTTPVPSSVTYYYCTATKNTSVEIQCSSVDGDRECCEEETTQEVFCCGGKVSGEWVEDTNRAVQMVARVFYTLAAVTLCIHVFMRRFH